MFVYLDNSATTKPYAEVVEEVVKYMEQDFGNPSSLHQMGLTSEKGIKHARKAVAKTLGAKEDEIVFTSGGTEADNLAIFGGVMWRQRRGYKLVTSAIEHPAVLESCKRLENTGFKVDYVEVDRAGRVNTEALEALLDGQSIMVSVIHANNEVGTIQPIKEINEIRKRWEMKHGRKLLLHIDAVQSYGKMRLDVNALEADFLSVSSHKIHGPKGVGALYIRKDIVIPAQIYGGGQEKNRRSGTENVPGIMGFGKAAELSHGDLKKDIAQMESVKKYLLEGIQSEIKDIRINGDVADSVPSILNVSFLGVRGEVLLHDLEQSGIYVSTGSACGSNKRGKSHVLKAMGLSEQTIDGAIRFSFSRFNTIEEMDYVLVHLEKAVARFRKLGSFR